MSEDTVGPAYEGAYGMDGALSRICEKRASGRSLLDYAKYSISLLRREDRLYVLNDVEVFDGYRGDTS